MPAGLMRRVAAVVGPIVLLLALGAPVAATFGSGGSSGGSSGGGKVNAFASTGGTVTSSTSQSGGDHGGPVCGWTQYLGTFAEVDHTGGTPYYRDGRSGADVDAAGPGVQTLYRVECPSGVSFRWATPSEDVDRQALINAARRYVERDVPLPVLDISPRPEVGTVVNVGLWLAVDDPGVVSAVAEVGPVWASVSARFTGTTWDMGNGEVVVCVMGSGCRIRWGRTRSSRGRAATRTPSGLRPMATW